MTPEPGPTPPDRPTPWLDTAVRLSLLVGLLAWSLLIVAPFLSVAAWGGVLATALLPAFERFVRLLGGRRTVAAVAVVVVPLSFLAVPTLLLVNEVVHDVRELDALYHAGKLQLPAPPAELANVPLAGPKLYAAWQGAHEDLMKTLGALAPRLGEFRGALVRFAGDLVMLVVKLLLALVVTALLLHRADSAARAVRALVHRAVGERSDRLVSLARDTTRSVGKGIVGVAVIQAALAGGGCAVAGIPASGLLTLLVLVLCVAQAGPLLVMGPAAAYLFFTQEGIGPWLFLGWTLFVSVIDNVLKPLLLGQGVEAPMIVVFLGAVGGLLSQGILGLFLGPVVLVVAYQIIERWLESATPPEARPSADG